MGRKKQKVRWTSVEEGFFINENDESEQSGTTKVHSSLNQSTFDTNTNNYSQQKQISRRSNKKAKYLMSQASQEKSSEGCDGKSESGCGSKDCESCTCDMYCCCTTHEHTASCDDMSKYKYGSKNSKMGQSNSESNNTNGNSADLNEATISKDCDTNSEHSSMMNESLHSSNNNSNRSMNMQRVESFSSSGTGSRDYERPSNHGERRYERKYQYNRDGSRRSYGGSERGGGSTWVNAPLAPRFERKAAIYAANAAANGNNYHAHHYGDHNGSNNGYDDCSMSMDMEDLPNGFTKIRSKNLDVLFKKDYYAQRVHLNSGSSGTGATTQINSCSVSPNPQIQSVTQQQAPLTTDSTQPEAETEEASDDNSKGCNNTESDRKSEISIGGATSTLTIEAENHETENKKDLSGDEPDEIGTSSNNSEGGNDIQKKVDSDQRSDCNKNIAIDAQNTSVNPEPSTSLTPTETLCSHSSELVKPETKNSNELMNAKNCTMYNNDGMSTEYASQLQDTQNQNLHINTNAVPYYTGSQVSTSTEQLQRFRPETSPILTSTENALTQPNVTSVGNSKRSNLFLYTPSTNTIIPCEEIIIPNHPNVIQQPMKINGKEENLYRIQNGTVANTKVSSEMLESNSIKSSTMDEDSSNKENEQNSSINNYTALNCPTSNVDISSTRIPLKPAVSTNYIDTESKNTVSTSPATPGMNGNAPAFIPRAQYMQYMQHVQQPAHTMIHYDQFGAPYTSYHGAAVPLSSQTTLSTGHTIPPAPGIPSLQNPVISREYLPNTIQYHQQSSLLSNASVTSSADITSGNLPTSPNIALNSSDTSSAESSVTMHSPADLSVYSPANWVPSTTTTSQVPVVGDHSRNGNMLIPPQMPLNRIDGPEAVTSGPRPITLQQPDFNRSMSSPASYGSQGANVSNVNGSVPYSPEVPIGYQQRPQYPPHFNSHVYYHPSAPTAHYVNNQGGSNGWYNLPQQQYYSMNGTQAFVGPQYQGYVNGYTSSSGGTNFQFMCESSTMPSSAGDSMAEDDPRDRSEEEIDGHNQSRTHTQNHRQNQAHLATKNDMNQHLPSITEQDRLKSQKQNYPRHVISNNSTVMVSTNAGAGNFSSKKDKDVREGSNGRDEGMRPFIPGLPAERLANKRVHKKRRKKKNTPSDSFPGEQTGFSVQSSKILNDGHKSMPNMIAQHQKGISINTIHRGSSSSEDLYSESNMIRSDNAMVKVSTMKANSIENDSKREPNGVKSVENFSNNKDPQSLKACDEGAQIETNSSKALPKRNLKDVDSSNSKSSGCDKEKLTYQICDSLAEGPTEVIMPSLPTTSPSSPMQSINPSSSSILISSSCLSSQEEDDNDKIIGQADNQSGLRKEIGRKVDIDKCLHKRIFNRDRSSSFSSNEEIDKSSKDMVLELDDAYVDTAITDSISDMPNNKQIIEHRSEEKQKVASIGSNIIQGKSIKEKQRESIAVSSNGLKYAETLKKNNAAIIREEVPFRANISRREAVSTERAHSTENQASEISATKFEVRSRAYQNGSQYKQKNKQRTNNNVRTVPSNEHGQRNSSYKCSKQIQSTNKLQRSLSSQNSQYKGSMEDITSDGKKLYSKVACKASDINQQASSTNFNKSQVPSKRGTTSSKKDSCISKPHQENIVDYQHVDVPHKAQDKSSNNVDGEIRRRNSADDAGWEMATGAHGGSKTRRNRKGNRSTNASNVIQPAEAHRDLSLNKKESIGPTVYSNKSLDGSPTRDAYISSEYDAQQNKNESNQDNKAEQKETKIPENKEHDLMRSDSDVNNMPNKKEETAEVESQASTPEEKISSSPASKSSTLRRQRKKRSSQDTTNPGTTSGANTTTPSTIRPVLIQDGAIDIFGKGTQSFLGKGTTGNLLKNKSAEQLLDQVQIDEAVQKAHMDTLFISEIGYGMVGGPISMGRFGTSKYTPPDRSEEILPMQELLMEKQKADEEAEAASKNTVIKVLMGEVQVSTAVDLAETATKSIQEEKEANGRFQDVTDKINENLNTENNLSIAKPKLITVPTPAELDLD